MSSTINSRFRRSETAYLAVPILPLALMLIVIAVGLAREHLAAQRVSEIVSKAEKANEPFDGSSLSRSYSKMRSRPLMTEALEVESAARHVARHSEILRKLGYSEQVFKRQVEMAKPVLAAGRLVSAKGGNFNNGYYGSDYRGLYHQFNHFHFLNGLGELSAFGNVDRTETMEMLRLGGYEHREILSRLYGPWSIDQLKELRRAVAESGDANRRWQGFVATRVGIVLARAERIKMKLSPPQYENSPGIFPFAVAPSHILSKLTSLEEMRRFSDVLTPSDYHAIVELEQQKSFSLVAVPDANSVSFSHIPEIRMDELANRFWIDAMNQRRVITAIGIKQFRVEEGRWPKSLSELRKVGLSDADWKIVRDQDFGYRVISNGRTAQLWTAGFSVNSNVTDDEPLWHEDGFRTPTSPPSENLYDKNHFADMESQIHD